MECRATIGIFFLAVFGMVFSGARGCDPELPVDFGLTSATSGANFTYKGFEYPAVPAIGNVTVLTASIDQFAGLNNLGLSSFFFSFGVTGIVGLHYHPRASEIFYVIKGIVFVGFVDSNNKLYSSTLYPGDLFVFPRGLIHFQYNYGPAVANGISSFNSVNPGLILIDKNVFHSTPLIPDIVLQKSFNASLYLIKYLEGTGW